MLGDVLCVFYYHIKLERDNQTSFIVCYCFTVKGDKGSSDSNWLRTVATSGTLGDKIAALTLQVQVNNDDDDARVPQPPLVFT